MPERRLLKLERDGLAKVIRSRTGHIRRAFLRKRPGDPRPTTIQNYTLGATVRPTIWPTPVLYEGDTLAFDILAVASPDPGSDLTVVIQT